MTDQHKPKLASVDVDDFPLDQHLARLQWDIPPERDLWPDTSSRIKFADRRKKITAIWQPLAVAASLVLAVGAIVFTGATYQMNVETKRLQANTVLFQQAQLALIEQQHKMVRVQFTQLLQHNRNSMNPQLVSVSEILMSTIDHAAAEIKNAMVLQPNDPNYASKLVSTYQQEVNMLNRISSDNRSTTQSNNEPIGLSI